LVVERVLIRLVVVLVAPARTLAVVVERELEVPEVAAVVDVMVAGVEVSARLVLAVVGDRLVDAVLVAVVVELALAVESRLEELRLVEPLRVVEAVVADVVDAESEGRLEPSSVLVLVRMGAAIGAVVAVLVAVRLLAEVKLPIVRLVSAPVALAVVALAVVGLAVVGLVADRAVEPLRVVAEANVGLSVEPSVALSVEVRPVPEARLALRLSNVFVPATVPRLDMLVADSRSGLPVTLRPADRPGAVTLDAVMELSARRGAVLVDREAALESVLSAAAKMSRLPELAAVSAAWALMPCDTARLALRSPTD
jgi:hypothetical protein